jgi:predicted  nucleic acid-binding Zn-ribbon protein
VSAELEMVKRALQNDEQETLQLLDQLRKTEERAVELGASYSEASERVGPKRDELLAERSQAEKDLEAMRAERDRFAAGVNASELKVYDAIRAGGRSIAVADLTDDGACGHCFGMIPLQLRNEIRHGRQLIRCEGCGVILTTATSVAAAAGGS